LLAEPHLPTYPQAIASKPECDTMDIRVPRGVESIIIIKRDDEGRHTRTTFRRSERRKRGSEPLDSMGRAMRKMAEGQRAAAEKYLEKHDRSNRDRRDGWARDLPYNVYQATSRGLRKVYRALGLS
jgi:hypothetical protein